MDYQPDRDLLSDLPLSIIHIILALVPIRDAVRTSILSRQWRYTWASLPHLVFEEKCASFDPKIVRKFEKRVENFITRALLHHKGPIHLFKTSVSFLIRSPDIDDWILCLSRNDIKEFILHMGETNHHDSMQVHPSIYSCEKLTKLELCNCELDPPPFTFKGFLFLRCLILRDVWMSSYEIKSLVANSPLLERFDLLENVSTRSRLRISAPNLKYLDICGDYIELCVSAPLLAEMSVELLHQKFTANKSVCNYTNFMGSFTNLEKLSGSTFFTEYLSMGIESCHHTLVFHHLKDIELNFVDFEDIKAVSVVARLIVGAPNLENLKVETDHFNEGDDVSEAPYPSSRDFGCAPNCTFEKLRVVKMSALYDHPHPLVTVFLKILFESSPVLETMSVCMLRHLTEENKQNVTTELLGFGRASPNAELSLT